MSQLDQPKRPTERPTGASMDGLEQPSRERNRPRQSPGVPELWLPRLDRAGIKQVLKQMTLQDVVQLRLPIFLTVVVGRFNFSYCWLFLIVYFTVSIYTLYRTRRAELLRGSMKRKQAENPVERLSRGSKPQEMMSAPGGTGESATQVKLTGRDKHMQRMCVVGELYLHVLIGQFVAYHIGYYRADTVLLLPVVEIVCAFERFFPSVERQCRSRGYSSNAQTATKFGPTSIPDAKKALYFETMSVNPVEVSDEWFNLLLAQFWQVFGQGWVSEYVQGWIEIFTVQLGLETEVCDFGTIPLQVRQLVGKKRTAFEGSSIQRDHPDDWIYDLDLHLELDTDELLIRLCYPIAGFKFPISVDHLRLSGAFRVEFEFIPLDERDGRAANPFFPNLCGMKIYFTERPEIDLTLWIGGLFDLVGVPLIGWIIQKYVVDNIVCYGCNLGPNCLGQGKMDIWGNEHPRGGAVAKTLMERQRDRKRSAAADMDVNMSMACRLAVKVLSARNLPEGSTVYCILKYGNPEELEKDPQELADGVQRQCRAHDGNPAYSWDTPEDVAYEWVTAKDSQVLSVVLMKRNRSGEDDRLGSFEMSLGQLRRDLDLAINRKASVKECLMGHHQDIAVELEVQFKGVSELRGIRIEKGTSLAAAQAVECDSVAEGDESYFMRQRPLEHVGGVLRVQLSRLENLPPSFRSTAIYVSIICGPKSRYGHKVQTLNSKEQDHAALWAKPLTKSHVKNSKLTRFQTEPKKGSGASLEREWSADGRFHLDIAGRPSDVLGRPAEEVICLQVWRDDKLSADDYLGGTCLPLADLEADFNGAMFSKMAFRVKLVDGKGKLLQEDMSGKSTTVNFMAEFVPNIEFSYA